MKQINFFLLLLACVFSIDAKKTEKRILKAGAFKDTIEIVQSYPKGTEAVLKTPGIRFARAVWRDMAREAKKTIEIGAFYFADKKGEPLGLFIKAIKKAAKRGVKIYIIADALQYNAKPQEVDDLAKVLGICVRIIDMKAITGGVMHAKYMIVDGKDLFIGSQNFDWQALKHIREIGIRIRNERMAKTVKGIFDADWALSKPINPSKDCPVTDGKKDFALDFPDAVNKENPIKIKQFGQEIVIFPAFSPAKLNFANLDAEEPTIVDLIDGAKKQILVQVMQFSSVTWEKELYATLTDALKRAALRKVHIKMIFADWSIFYPSTQFIQGLSIIPYINIKFGTIPPWKGKCVPFSRVEHCKYMVVDDNKLWIGTGNWTRSYFYGCRNIGMSIVSTHLNKVMQNLFFNDWNGPYTKLVDPDKKYERPDYQCKHVKDKKGKVEVQFNRAFMAQDWHSPAVGK